MQSTHEVELKSYVAHEDQVGMDECDQDAHLTKRVTDAAHLFQEDSEGHVLVRLLIPRPTDDPKDPLTWHVWRKYLATFSVSYFIFLSYYITSSLNPILVTIATHFDVSVTRASWLISFNVLFLGIGNLLWIPLAQKIGKRPVILICTAMFFASSIWCAVANTYGSMLGARIIQGLGASASEVLAPAVVADLFFVHERGLWVGVAMFNITLGSSLGGIFAGLVANANSNWRWVFWMNTVLTGVCFLVAALFSPETNFRRPPENEGGEGRHPSELEAIRARANSSWMKSISVTGWYDRETSIWWLWLRPWLTLRYPAVPWASLLIGLNLGAYVMISTANSAVFPELYNFTSLGVGNIAIGYLISGIFGCLAGGPSATGLLPPSPNVEVATFSPSFACVVSTCIAYVVDCYRPFAGDTITVFTAFKNTVTFGLTFAVFPWLAKSGPLKLSGYLLLIEGVVFLSAIPIVSLDQRFRDRTNADLIRVGKKDLNEENAVGPMEWSRIQIEVAKTGSI
ncbi:hypothetical protein CLAIMM_12411 [Cladophialophora immunda]|nr:hypothetical protein CLAIMM_12411 [Cladophialophora immunda]